MTKRVRKIRKVKQQKIVQPHPKTPYKSNHKDSRFRSDAIFRVEPNGKESHDQANRRYRIEEELLRACMAEGMTREQTMKVMKKSEAEVAIVEKRLLANDGIRYLNMSTGHRYYQYTIQQEQCVRDLDYILNTIISEMDEWNTEFKDRLKNHDETKMPPKPSVQSAVIAIKAKSDISDRVIKMGQEMGIIEKRAKEMRISGNLNLAALDTEELKRVLSKKLDEFQGLVASGTLPSVYKNMLKNRSRKDERARLTDGKSTQDVEV